MDLTPTEREAALTPPAGKVRIILDTDAGNGYDDQFTIVYALLSERIACEAIYAAPFASPRFPSETASMEASYREINTILELMGEHGPAAKVLRGATQRITDPAGGTQHSSANPAAIDLIERCLHATEPVIVVSIAPLTNIASALLLEPRIADKMVLLWLGGQPDYHPTAYEFNLISDLAAAQLVFDSGLPLIHFPCTDVAEKLRYTDREVDELVGQYGRIGTYLTQRFQNRRHRHGADEPAPIWDLAPVAWLNNPEWVPSKLTRMPRITNECRWDQADPSRPLYRIATGAQREPVLKHLSELMRKAYGQPSLR